VLRVQLLYSGLQGSKPDKKGITIKWWERKSASGGARDGLYEHQGLRKEDYTRCASGVSITKREKVK